MLITVDETIQLIEQGKTLHIAGDKSLLNKLPAGNWIGGTTPYFTTQEGGVFSKEKLFVNDFSVAEDKKIINYNENTILEITKDAFENGATLLIIPYASKTASEYAKKSPEIKGLYMYPVIGWISGYDLEDSSDTAMVYNGIDCSKTSKNAIALHLKFAEDKQPDVSIINIFEFDLNSDVIEFKEESLEVTQCLVNGKEGFFSDYITENNINTKLPLIASYNGVNINVSIKNVNEEEKTVSLYASVFKDKKYYFAKETNYQATLKTAADKHKEATPIFSCNCILNYLYGNIEGKSSPTFEGPVTFGEIAYQLLNQTLVYLNI